MDEGTSNLGHGLLELNEGNVLVVAEFEVVPFLLLDNFLSVNNLRDIFLFGMNLDNVSPAQCIPVPVCPGSVFHYVVYGVNAFERLGDQAIF